MVASEYITSSLLSTSPPIMQLQHALTARLCWSRETSTIDLSWGIPFDIMEKKKKIFLPIIHHARSIKTGGS
jgi:hypothetical protein